MSQPNYITCACQNCNGHIKFDANDLKLGETRRIECPHCHLETIIFDKQSDTKTTRLVSVTGIKSKSSKIELFLFELTRLPAVIGAVLVLLAFAVAVILALQTLLPEKTVPFPTITYDAVAPAPKMASEPPNSEHSFIPQGAKIAKRPFPQPIVDFLMEHQQFSLKEWLNQLNADQRKAFLENLAAVLTTANAKHLASDKMEPLVRDFADLWTTYLKDEAIVYEKKVQARQARFSLITSVASGLFISLMTLSLVLVLLAIERNTRSNRVSESPR